MMMAPDAPSIGETVEILAKAKTAVEDRVRIIRYAHQVGRVEDDGLRDVEQAYGVARADVNGLVERLAIETIQAGEPDPATMEASITRARDGMQAFLAQADRTALGVARSPQIAEVVAGLVEGLGKSLVELWKAVRGARAEQRRELAEQLRRYLWLPFDQVPVADKGP
jgi:hypothetical protein